MRKFFVIAILAIAAIATSVPAMAQPKPAPVASNGIKDTTGFNPIDYGAHCSGKTLVDVTTAAGSATISSASYQFKATDVGASLTIDAGVNLVTTGNTTAGSYQVLAIASIVGVKEGDYVRGPGIAVGTRVALVGRVAGQLTLSKPALTTTTGMSLILPHIVNTTIASVAGGNATLATTLGSTSPGVGTATFGQDDTAAIMRAVNAAGTKQWGGAVRLPAGMCIVSDTLYIPTRVSVLGQGPGASTLKWLSLRDMDYTNGVIGNHTAKTSTTCTLDAAKAYSDNEFAHFKIDLSAATQTSYYVVAKGVAFMCSYNNHIHNLYIVDSPASGLCTDYGYGTILESNIVVNAGRLGYNTYGSNGIGQGVTAFGTDSYLMSNNLIINPAHYGIFVETQLAATSPHSQVTITGNIILGGPNSMTGPNKSGAAGIGISGEVGATITGNHIVGFGATTFAATNSWNGIGIDSGTMDGSAGAFVTVTGNTISGVFAGINLSYQIITPVLATDTARTTLTANTISDTFDSCIRVVPFATGNQMDSVAINDNILSRCGAAGVGIYGTGAVSNFVIANNVISNAGVLTATAYRKAGIALGTTTADGIDIHGNRIYDNITGTQKYGISINTGTAVTGTIQINDLVGNATQAFSNLGTFTGWITNNRGYNPVGASVVTAGASPWIYTAGNSPETLFLNGGTISSVAKGGVTLSTATPAQVELQPGEAVTVTYTVAPTAAADKH